MAKAKDSKPAKGDTKGGNKTEKSSSSSKKGGGNKGGGGKADADSNETKSTKLKGAQTIQVRHILVGLSISRHLSKPVRDDLTKTKKYSARNLPRARKPLRD